MDTPQDARSQINYALLCACSAGHQSVAQWLHSTFGICATDARDALRWALRGGHHHCVQWLCVTYNMAAAVGCRATWTQETHDVWYLQPHTVAAASHLPKKLLANVLCRL